MTQLVHTCLRNFRLGNENVAIIVRACCCGRQLQRTRASCNALDEAQRSLWGRVWHAKENIVGIVCGTSEVWGGSTKWLFSKCSQRHFHKMPLKTNRIKFKVAVCGQYLGYDRSNEGPLLFLHCYFECIKIDASLICRPYLQNNHYNRHCTYSGVTLFCH